MIQEFWDTLNPNIRKHVELIQYVYINTQNMYVRSPLFL